MGLPIFEEFVVIRLGQLVRWHIDPLHISTDGYTIAQIAHDFKRGGEQMQLRQLREAAGLTQRELGNRIGVSGQAVAQWETGIKRPSVENLTKLADVLETSTDAILGRDSA